MSEQDQPSREIMDQARQQGATHYSPRFKEFYRPGSYPGSWESAMVLATGKLSEWSDEWRTGRVESAGRI